MRWRKYPEKKPDTINGPYRTILVVIRDKYENEYYDLAQYAPEDKWYRGTPPDCLNLFEEINPKEEKVAYWVELEEPEEE